MFLGVKAIVQGVVACNRLGSKMAGHLKISPPALSCTEVWAWPLTIRRLDPYMASLKCLKWDDSILAARLVVKVSVR